MRRSTIFTLLAGIVVVFFASSCASDSPDLGIQRP